MVPASQTELAFRRYREVEDLVSAGVTSGMSCPSFSMFTAALQGMVALRYEGPGVRSVMRA